MGTGPARAVPAAAAAWTLLVALGCASMLSPTIHIEGEIEQRGAISGSGSFQAGAARVDLTPTPGIPMNYSLDGKVSRGFWTRLFVRAIYAEDENGQALVFVSGELPHIPNGLGDRVAEIVRERPNLAHIGREQIVLAATHTHNGPENFFSDGFYNSFPSPRAGFDRYLFEHLAKRIAEAIDAAHERKEPAELSARSAKLERLFRNRSFGAFRNNADGQEFVLNNGLIPDDCELAEKELDEGKQERDACRAVRAAVEVIDFIGTGSGDTIAKAVFLAAHPTVLGKETQIFQTDVLGVAATLLERSALSECTGSDPIVAFFNGAQGDASFTWKERNRWELLNEDTGAGRLGLAVQLARFVCGVDPGESAITFTGLPTSPKIAFQFDWLDLHEPRHIDDPDGMTPSLCDPWNGKCTTPVPLPGVTSMGGAQDGRTFWYELGVQEGLRAPATSKHGRKTIDVELQGTVIKIVPLVTDPDSMPHRVPVGVYELGGLVFVSLPGEFTAAMGERIRNAVSVAATVSSENVLLVGLANGHLSYITTPEEFDAQYYEGASNLFGAATGPLIETKLSQLAAQLGGESTTLPTRAYFYDPGFCRIFLPSDAGLPTHRPDDGLGNILLDVKEADPSKRALPERTFPSLCWYDAIPKLSRIPDDCTRAVPYVWVEPTTADPDDQCKVMFGTALGAALLADPCGKPHEETCTSADPRYCGPDNRAPVDNCGLDLVTVLHGSYDDRTHWCSYWMPDGAFDPANYSICVAGVTDRNIVQEGEALSLSGDLPADATLDSLGIDDNLAWALSNALECRGCDTRDVCEWPFP